MKRRAIVESLGDFKHRLQADRNQMMKIALHLREFHGTRNYDSVFNIIEEIEKFNSERLGDLLDRINELIEKEDV